MTTRLLLLLPVIAAGWLGLLASVMALTDDAPAAIVLFPSAGFLDALPAGIAIVSESALTVTLASTTPGLTAALYRAGARVVLPAGLAGCSAT